ncbi:MAG TPA: hypothetical protein VH593_32125 [Ktedonobacteraceae bacterium]
MAKKRPTLEALAGYHVTLTYLDSFRAYKADVLYAGETIWETKTQADPRVVIDQAWEKLHELAREHALAQKRSERALRTVQDTLDAHGV